MIQVELRLLAGMKSHREGGGAPNNGAVFVGVPLGATLAGFLDQAGIDQGRTLVVLVNGRYAAFESMLNDGDVVSVFPPVAGG